MSPRSRLVAALALALASACGDATPEAGPATPSDPAPLRGGLASLDDVGRAVVDGLDARDPAALAALLVDEQDFKQRLFAVLGNAPGARQFGADLTFTMQRQESLDDIGHAVDELGGQSLRYVRLEPERVERRGEIAVHRRPTLIVTDPAGRERALHVLGSVLEHVPSASFKLLSYRYRN